MPCLCFAPYTLTAFLVSVYNLCLPFKRYLTVSVSIRPRADECKSHVDSNSLPITSSMLIVLILEPASRCVDTTRYASRLFGINSPLYFEVYMFSDVPSTDVYNTYHYITLIKHWRTVLLGVRDLSKHYHWKLSIFSLCFV